MNQARSEGEEKREEERQEDRGQEADGKKGTPTKQNTLEELKQGLPGSTSPNPRPLAVGWLSGLLVRECVLCTYSYAGVRLACSF